MRRRGGGLVLLLSALGSAAAVDYGHYGHDVYHEDDYHREEPYGYGHVEPKYGHEEPYGYGHEEPSGYGHEEPYGYEPHHAPHHYSEPKCKDGFYGQCKKDKWGRCIQPPNVGVWELTPADDYNEYTDQRWLVQFGNYDFCKQSGNYRVTPVKGLTESVAYGTYVWEDPKYFKMIDYSFNFGYKYPYPITAAVTWKQDFKIIGYGNENAKSVEPVVGITRDLYGHVTDKVITANAYRKLKGPHERIKY
eukprot:Selendium_serpulae@DN5744_c4_g2_i2.p2